MRILWWSNAPWVCTGYGQQTALFTPRIAALGHEVAIFAFYGLRGARVGWNGIECYPAIFDRWGNDAVSAHAGHFKADIVLSLVDASACQPQMWTGVKWVPWFPVDGVPVRPNELTKLRRAYQPLVFSRFGEEQAREAGLDVRYVPHGVDTTVFQPIDQAQAREACGFPQDRYIAGIVGANKGKPSRKAYPEQILAFKAFKERHEDALLYIHAHKGADLEGIDLPTVCRSAGLDERDVIYVGQYPNLAGTISSGEMAMVYNSLDVLLSVSHGEGFGVPILEAQACGTPVIVGDWTSMSELCFGGWKVDKADAQKVWTNFSTWQWQPRSGAIADALEQSYRAGRPEAMRQVMRAKALEYDADRVTEEYWRPVLAEMEGWQKEGSGELQLVKF